MYHRGTAEEKIWSKSEKKGLHKLLNLVADEHLERNLRALDRRYGDRLKRLGAFAFQHNRRSYNLTDLLRMLGARALAVLPAAHLGVCRNSGEVTIDNGQLLQEMERQGSSFARFFRALRMGLGNRHNDPKVEAGLKLFGRKFRHMSMKELWKVVRELRKIFGAECQMLKCIDQDSMCTGDGIADGEGISNEEIQAEIRRISKPPKGRTAGGGGKASGPRWINVSNVEDFPRIHNVVRVPHDPDRYAAYSGQVRRDAQTFRRYLEELGIRYQPSRRTSPRPPARSAQHQSFGDQKRPADIGCPRTGHGNRLVPGRRHRLFRVDALCRPHGESETIRRDAGRSGQRQSGN